MASLASFAGSTARNHARRATATVAATSSRSTLTRHAASASVLSSSFSSPWAASRTTTTPRFFSTETTNDNEPTQNNPTPKSQSMEFQAETKQLLDIVTHSLYSDKEVFLRELISNASDACEKLRHLQQQSVDIVQGSEVPLEIRIDLDEVTSTITISDTGIGMTRDDMISNLGTIARSGSKNFLAELQSKEGGSGMDIARGIIGKFGVGFYSVFMIANKVEVRSRTAYSEEPATVWTSEGTGTFDVAPLPDDVRQDRGTSIIIHLDSDYWHYCDETKIKEILNKYSNFVQFPILVNGLRVNTVQAVWSQDPKEVEYDTYVDFYKFIANAIDNPLDILHFRAEVPLDLKALFYIPSFHSEKYGMDRMEPGISLYSRKVLIESKCPDIVPDWMRFVKGVVDSEDLPLSISREKPQDSALMGKLSKVLTRKFIAHLEKMAKKEPEKYMDEFYREYAFFLKEGICQDFEFQPQLAKLLRVETSKNITHKMISLDEYISNMRPEQKDIYYLCAPTREAAAMSPYLEAFEKANLEVIYIYTAIDDFVMANIDVYQGRNLVSVEKGDIDLSPFATDEDNDKDIKEKDGEKSDDSTGEKLGATEAMELCAWFKVELGESKIASCRPSSRLVSSPAIVTDNESGAMRRMMRMVDTSDGNRDSMPLPKQNVEINPSHPIIVGLAKIRRTEPVLARVLAEQVYDNCLVAAGLMDDSRTMLPRLNDLLISLVKGAQLHSTTSKGPSNESEDSDDTKK